VSIDDPKTTVNDRSRALGRVIALTASSLLRRLILRPRAPRDLTEDGTMTQSRWPRSHSTIVLLACLSLAHGCGRSPSGPEAPTYESVLVDPNGGGDYLTIQEGIDAVSDGDTVLVSPGTYTGPGNRRLDFGGTNLVLKGIAGPDSTILDCEQQDRGFFLHNGENAGAVIEGVTVTNGTGDDGHQSGGGLLCFGGASPTVRNVVLSYNEAPSGGGLASMLSSPTLMNVTFLDNTADLAGGGIYCGGCTITLSHVTFARNTAPRGGGMSCKDQSSPRIENATFARNGANSGGGIECDGGSTPRIENTIIAFNTVGEAIVCSNGGDPAITHSCIFGNPEGDSLCGNYHDNIFVDPRFCDVDQSDFSVCGNSDCLPENNAWGELVGAHGEGCGPCDESKRRRITRGSDEARAAAFTP
jgi:predicted outer membrane repeat protein